MVKHILFQFSLALFCATFAFSQRQAQSNKTEKSPGSTVQAAPLKSESKEGTGALRQVEYFNRLQSPNGSRTTEDMEALWRDLDAMPAEPSSEGAEANPADWQYVSHFGAQAGASNYFTGRITDIEASTHGVRVLSASGGLWKWIIVGIFPVPVPISDKLNSNWGGAFSSHPTNADIIFLGTGEPQIRAGTGMWKTINGGKSWSKVTMSPQPTSFYKIAYHPTNANIMWAATDIGLYKSSNGGTTWSRKRTGNVTDFVVRPGTPTQMFCVVWNSGFYKSTNTGDTWTLMTTGGIPTTDIGRSEMAVTPANSSVIYTVVTNSSNNQTKGIYKSTDAGVNWVPCNHGGTDFHWGQGWYNVALAVDPTNANIVLAGGGGVRRSTDGFNFADVDGKHADQHCMEFSTNGNFLYLGNDGGYFTSSDDGATFSGASNWFPISQFYHMSVGKSDPRRMGGGTQDDGLIYTRGAGYDWTSDAGDGSGFAIDPFNGNHAYALNGIWSGGLASRAQRSLDGCVNWTDINTGINPSGEWFPVIRTDRFAPTYQWTERDGYVYRTINQGNDWFVMNTGGLPFPVDVWDLTVSHGSVPNVYACLAVPNNSLQVFDRTTGTWIDRSAGLPTTGTGATYVKKVVPSTSSAEPDVAYAVMGGTPTGAIRKVYKTTNRGATWINLTGNLPNVACTDIIPHPTDPNVLVLGTEAGAFRTDDGGVSWFHWWEGMPRSIQITEMDYVDSVAANGKFYVYCSTFGRGIWKREMGQNSPRVGQADERDEPVVTEAMPMFRLDQNLGHHAGAQITAIPYYMGEETRVRISLYNESGQLVRVIVDEVRPAGLHQEELALDDLPSGVYFYAMETKGWHDTKKLVVAR